MSTKESDPDFRELFKRSLAKVTELKARLESSESAQSAKIAIIGMGCRFPGGGENPQAYWNALQSGVDGITEIPASRWPADAIGDSSPGTGWAGLLPQSAIEGLDAAFFGLSPREADSLDPQQRLLLEVVWETLESSGQRLDELLNSPTGVFVGMCSLDYRQMAVSRPQSELSVYDGTGNSLSTAAGRLSYTLGLQGPCFSVDTACSSSLVAIHLACQSLRRGECELAIAAGVNLILDPTTMLLVARTKALSPQGRCKTFDAGANGFVRSEGCGTLLLKRLADAQRDRDPILAVICGSAVNQDGRSTGLTAPNVLAQQKLLRQALENAKVTAAELGFIETHGTATPLGDPIELEALKAVYGAPRADGSPCILGAVKTNIGHLEAAAGMAGIIKAILCLQHQAVPANLHFRALNPRIDLSDTAFVIPRESTPWPSGNRRRLAGVSSFGISGTNAHIIVEEAPTLPAAATPPEPSRDHALCLSAHSAAALRAQATQYIEYLKSHPEQSLPDIAYTANVRRSHKRQRLAVVGSTQQQWLENLQAFVAGSPAAGLRQTDADAPSERKLVFVFSGQDARLLAMRRELLSLPGAFRDSVEACGQHFRQHCGWSLMDVLTGNQEALLDRSDVRQPALFALQMGLCAVLAAWGVLPDAVVGQGLGELAAAQVGGWLSLEESCQLVCLLSQQLAGDAAESSQSLTQLLSSVQGRRGEIAFYSPANGRLRHGPPDSRYWKRCVTAAPPFDSVIQTLAQDGFDLFLQLTPEPTLLGDLAAKATAPGIKVTVLGALQEAVPASSALLATVGELHVRGYSVAWAKHYPHGGRVLALPTYPWQRRRHWLTAPTLPIDADSDGARRYYAPRWRLHSPPARLESRKPGTWLLLLDEGGLGEQLAQALEAAGASCLRVQREQPGDGDPSHPAWLQSLNGAALQGVIDLQSLDSAGDSGGRAAACRRNLERAANYLRGMVELHTDAPIPVWLLTQGAVAVAPMEPITAVEQAPLWGLGRVLSLEHPELWGGLIDLPRDNPALQLPALAALLLAQDKEDHIALRSTGLYVQRLERRELKRGASWKTSGTALVTGGLGAIGLQVAQWVAGCGAEHIVLVGRSGQVSPEAAKSIAALQEQGAAVTVAAADIGDAAAMAALLARIDAQLPPLRSVFHAAGVAVMVPLKELAAAHLEQSLRSKVTGTLVLEETLGGRPLDALVCFSSISAVWGAPLLGAYAAANAFLDAWAQTQRAQGRPAVSINWGPWTGGGMVTEGMLDGLATRGVKALGPADSLQALTRVLADGESAQVAIAEVDWPRFRALYESQKHRPLMQDMEGEPPVARQPPAAWQSPLNTLSAEERRAQVTAAVRGAVAGVLKMTGAALPSDRPMRELGMDSLMAAELRNHLALPSGEKLPATLVYDYPTVDKLSDYLLSKLSQPPSGKPAVAAAPAAWENEPIAILGMGCRFPGGVTTPEQLWQLLAQGGDAISEVPRSRWDVEAYYDPDPDQPGKMYSRWGGFVTDVEQFDADFFGIAPREATSMDPQQRLLLEVSWEALEQAGQVPAELAGSLTGVFFGVPANEYGIGLANQPEAEGSQAYVATGNMNSIAAGRLSYLLGFSGPAMVVDTACSSSLTAVHLACQSLRTKESNLALAGGVNLILSPEATIAVSRLRALSKDGRCKTFDASADGMVRSEGCGVVVLKRLSDALRDGNRICAVIRGTAINQDGRSNGLTAPNGLAQQAVIRAALKQAGAAGGEVGYVESHGTGTVLGDPIELHALGAVLAEGRPPNSKVIVGALKTNLGHTEAASGVAGLIKTVLVLQHGIIPPNLHFRSPNPHIAWRDLPLVVPTELTSWPSPGAPRTAGVSSFGFSGTNAHVVLSDYTPPAPTAGSKFALPQNILPLSAKTPEALQAQLHKYVAHLAAHPAQPLAEVCCAAAAQRTHFAERLTILADSSADAQAKLQALLRSEVPPATVRGRAEPAQAPKIAFLFSGQGSQYIGMGYELYQTQPVFRAAIKRCAAILEPLLERPLLSVLYPTEDPGGPALLHETAYTQPALFAVEYALSELWRSWGIKPDAVIGHSVGEYVAACVAGVFTLEDVLRLLATRARLMQALPKNGEMASVQAEPEQVLSALQGLEHEVSIAAFNAPDQTVISGRSETVQAVCAVLADKGLRATKLVVSHANHSPLTEPMLTEFEAAAAPVAMMPPRLTMISNLTGEVAGDEVTHPVYWRRHVREPVRFADGMEALKKLGIDTFIELGPHTTLLGLGLRCLSEPGNTWLASLRKGKKDWEVILESLGHLWVKGAPVDFKSFAKPYGWRPAPVPTYPFQHERYWLAAVASPTPTFPLTKPPTGHALSGQALQLPGLELHQVLPIGRRRQPFLADHVVYENVVVPGAFYLAVLLAIASDRFGATTATLRDVHFIEPLWLKQDTNLHILLRPSGEQQYAFTVSTAADETKSGEPRFREHAEGTLLLSAAPAADSASADTVPQGNRISPQEFLDRIAELRIRWGPRWRRIAELRTEGQRAFARLGPTNEDLHHEGPLAPVVIDNAFAATLSPLLDAITQSDGIPYLPWSLRELRWYGSPTKWTYCHSRLTDTTRGSAKTVTGDLVLRTETGQVLAVMNDFVCRLAPEHAFLHPATNAIGRWLYTPQWRRTEPSKVQAGSRGSGRILVLSNQSALAAAVAQQLRAQETAIICVRAGQSFGRIDSQTYQINPEDPQDYQTLLREVNATEGGCAGIVHMWGLEATPVAQTTADTLARDQGRGSISALHLVQALVHSGWRELPRLWLVTAGTQSVDGDRGGIAVAQAPLWGIGKTIAAEHPELLCTRIDVPSQPTAADGTALAQELLSGSREEQVVLRPDQRYVARLVFGSMAQTELSGQPVVDIHANGAYLISGGLGGLGLAAAELLINHGAKQLVLLGRKAPDAASRVALERLQHAGAQVLAMALDVADVSAVAALMTKFGGELLPLRGIIHAAGVIDDGILVEQTPDRFRRVMAPKVQGGWNLHILSQRQPLDFFVCYSSATSLMGLPGQSNYVAANTFLDALVSHRRQIGLCGLSINWGPFSVVGLAAKSPQLANRFASHGIEPLTPSEGNRVLLRLLAQSGAQVGVLKLDLKRLFAAASSLALSPYFRELTIDAAPPDSAAGAAAAPLAEQLGRAAASEQPALLQEYLTTQLGRILRLPAAKLALNSSLNSLGMDSLMALELRNQLSADLQLTVPIPILLEGASVRDLASYLLAQLTERSRGESGDGGIEEGHI